MMNKLKSLAILLLVSALALLVQGCAETGGAKYVNNLDPIIEKDQTLLESEQGKYVRFVHPEYEVEAAAFAFGEIAFEYERGYREIILKDDAVVVVDLKIVNKTDKKIEFKDYHVMLFDMYGNPLYRWPEGRINNVVSLSLGEGIPANTALARGVLANIKENYFVVDESLLPKEIRRGYLAFTTTDNKKIRYPVKLDITVKYPNAILKFNKTTTEPAPSLF